MSTRATYQIDFTTFYIHHDGYPEGAAKYFSNALAHRVLAEDRAPNATLADDFIRANNRAELTPGHDVHADTEYQYTVSTVGNFRFGRHDLLIKAYHTSSGAPFFVGTVQEFIDKFGKLENVNE